MLGSMNAFDFGILAWMVSHQECLIAAEVVKW